MTQRRLWADRDTPAKRRAIMQAVGQKNTAPEMRVRKLAHRLGLRYRLHVKTLPGKPDLVFPRWRLCIFVHGCFWHRHPGCRKSSFPSVNNDLWEEKFRKTKERDALNIKALQETGWRVEIIWECETRQATLAAKLESIFFG